MMKKILLLIACASFTAAQCQMTHEQFLAEEAKTSAGKLSSENEVFIQVIMAKLGLTKNIEIRKPLESLIEVAPIYQFEYYFPASNIWYINEVWFNTLSEQERTFIVGYRLLAIQEIGSAIAFQQQIALIIQGIISLLLLLGLYKLIHSYPRILGFNNSKIKAFLLAYMASTALQSLAVAPIATWYLGYNQQALVLRADAKAARELACLDGALTVLTQLQTTIAPLYAHDKAFWKGLYETFPSRIAALEEIKKAKGIA